MFIKAATTEEIATGGMKAFSLNGREVVLCNYGGAFYAVERACGHAKARLERGTLTGWVLTCPLHYAQFDIRTGEALSGPAPKAPDSRNAPSDPSLETKNLKTWPVKTEGSLVFVDLP